MNISINNLGGSSPSVSSLISQLISKRTQSMNSLLDQKSAIESSLAQLQNGALSAGSINSSYSSQIASLQDTIDRLNEQYTINANKITTINSLKKSYSSTVSSLDSYIESLKNPNNAGKDLDIYLDGDKVSSNGNIGVTVNNNSTGIQKIDLTVTQLATTSVLKSNVLTGGSVTLNTKLTDLFAGKYDSTNNKVTGTRDDLKENMKVSDLGIKSGSFTIGSTKITIDADNDTLGSVMQKIRNAGYDVSIETVDYDDTGAAIGALSITGKDGKSVAITNQTTNFGSAVGLTVSEGNFTINGQSFNVTSTSTIGSLINEINYATADGVGAKFENGQLVFVASKTGEVDINVSKGTSNFTNAIGFTVGGVMNKDNLVMGTEGSYVTLTGLNDNVKLTDSVASGKFTEGSFTITHNKVDSNGTVLDEMVTTRIDVTSSDTVASIIEKIKSQTAFTYTDKDGKVVNGGLTAEIVDGKFRIRQLEKGADYHISVEAGSSTFTNYVGLTTSVSDGVAVSGNSSTLTGVNNVTASTTFTSGNFKITASSAYDSSVLETKTIEVTAGESLSSVIDKINNSGLAVTASIQDNKLVLTHKNYGENFKISVEAGSSNFTEKVGFTKTTSVGTSNDGTVSYVLGNATGMSNSTSGFTSGSFTIKTNALSSDGKTASSNMLSATIEVSSSDNLQSVMKKINNSGIGLTATIENGKLKISQVNSGEGFDIVIEAGDTNFTQKTGLTNSVSIAESSSSSSSYLLGTKVLPNSGFTAGTFTISTNKLSADGKSAEFEMLSATINVTTSDTRESIAQKITNAGIGLTASITSDGKIKIEQNNAGSDFEIKVEAGSTNFTEKAGLTTSVNNIGSLTPGKDVNQFTTLTGDKTVNASMSVTAGNFKINGVDIDFAAGTLQSAINTINSKSSQTGVTAAIKNGKLVLQSTVTGSDTSIYVENGTSNFGTVSGLISDSTMGGTATIGSDGSKTTLTGSWNVTSSTQISEGTIKINGYNIVLNSGTLQSAINTINSMSSQTGVTASIKDGKFVLTNVDSGTSTILVEEGSSDIARLTGIASYQSIKGTSEVNAGTKTALVASKTGLSGSTAISNSSITINGQEILLSGTIDSAIAAINAKTSVTGVEAYLDSDGRFVFANTRLGNTSIDLSFGYGDFGMKIGAKSSSISSGDRVTVSGGASVVGNTSIYGSMSIDGVGSILIETDPNPNEVIITNADEFVNAMTGKTEGKTFILACDIDLSTLTDSQKLNLSRVNFKGHLNGNGFNLKNYSYMSGSNADFGLFHSISNGGTVENIGILNFNITSKGGGGFLSSSVADGGIVRNVRISSSTVSGSNGASGLGGVGAITGLITNGSVIENVTLSSVTVKGGNRTGGIVGTSYGTTSYVRYCLLTDYSSVSGTYASLNGPFVGEDAHASIENCEEVTSSGMASHGVGASLSSENIGVSLEGCLTIDDAINKINSTMTGFTAFLKDGHLAIKRNDGSRDPFEIKYYGDGNFGNITGFAEANFYTSSYVSGLTGSKQFTSAGGIKLYADGFSTSVYVYPDLSLDLIMSRLAAQVKNAGHSFEYKIENGKVSITTDLKNLRFGSTDFDLSSYGLGSFSNTTGLNYSNSYESKNSILTGSVSGLNGSTVLNLDSVGEYRISGAKQDFVLKIEAGDTINSVIEKINSSGYYTAGLDSSGRFYIKATEQDYVTEAEANAQGYITVHNAQEFIDAVKYTAGVKVMLMADIDLSTINFDGFDYVNGLVLDGNGYTIKNYLSSSALFNEMHNTTIRNVALENFDVRNYTYAAALANKSYNSSVSTVLLKDSSLSGKYGIAGLIDNAYNTDISDSAVYNVSFSSGANGSPDIGGFVRLLQAGSTITNSSLNHSTTYGVSPTTNNSVNLSSDFSSVNFDGSTVDLGSITEALGSVSFGNRAEDYNAVVVSSIAAFIDSTSSVSSTASFENSGFGADNRYGLSDGMWIAGGYPDLPEYIAAKLNYLWGFSDIGSIYISATSGSGQGFDNVVGLNGESYTGSYSTNLGVNSKVTATGAQTALSASQALGMLTNGSFTISQYSEYEGKTISASIQVTKGMTVQDFINKINQSGTNFVASLSSNGQLVIKSNVNTRSTMTFGGTSNAAAVFGFNSGSVNQPSTITSGKGDEFSTLTGNASVTSNMTFTSGNFIVQIGNTKKEFDVYEGETLSSIMNKITQSDIGVSASIQNGKLVLTAKKASTDRIYLIDGTSNFAELTGFVASGGGQAGVLDKGELASYTSQNTAQSAQNQGFSAGNFFVHLTDINGNITNTATINIAENESIASIMDKINNSGLGVTASINDSGKMVITRNSSTTAGGVLVTKGSSDFTNKIGYTSGGFQSETTHRGQSTKLVSSNSIANSTRFTAGDFTIKMTGENATEININITENDSIQSIIEKINSKNAGVTASLDSNNRLVLSRDIDNGDGTIQVIKGSSNFTNVAGFTTGGYQTASTVEGVTASITSTNTVSSSKRFTDGDFIINDVHINISSTDSINDIVDKINASSAGVTASIVENKLVLTKDADQGAGNIVVQKGSSNFTKEMGFTTGGDLTAKFDDGSSTSIISTSTAQTAMSNGYTAGDFYIKWTDASGVDKSITVNIGNSGANGSVDSVSKIIESINSQNAGVTASLDSSGKLVITRDESEGAGSLTIVKGTSDFTNVIGLTSGGSFSGVSEGGLAATYTVLTSDKLSVSNRATMASMGITSGSFLINGVEIAVNATDTIDDVIGRINTIFNDSKYKDIAVTAEFKNNQIVLTTKKASADARIDVESGSTNFTQVVGFTDIASRNNAVELGQNAKFNIKLGNDTVGKDFELALDLKDITPDGIYNGNNLIYLDINGNVVMEENNAAITIEVKKTGETVIKLGQNLLDASINELNKFVGSFNKAMIASENEILSDDAEFTKLINNIKSALTSDIADIRKVTQQLAKIGIVVDVRGGTDSNMGTVRLSVDREAYTKAFYDDSENVLNLLLGKETATGTAKGILTRLNDVLYPEVYNNSGYFNKTPRQLNAIQKELKREITSTTFDLNELKNSVSGTGSTSGLSEYLAQLEQQYQLIQEAIDNLNKQYATSMTRLVLNKNNSSFNPIVS